VDWIQVAEVLEKALCSIKAEHLAMVGKFISKKGNGICIINCTNKHYAMKVYGGVVV
jgi:hypothetical protein